MSEFPTTGALDSPEQSPEATIYLAPAASEILDGIADPVAAFDRQFRFLYLNRRATEVLGKGREEVIGKSMIDLFPSDWSTEFREVCERAWREAKPMTIERRSGMSGHWVENHILPLGGALCVQWRNIGERKRAEAALRESEERYRGLFERMQEAFILGEIVYDDAGNPSDWRYLDVNSAFESMFGRKREEVVGRKYRDVFSGALTGFWLAEVGRVASTGEPAHFENYGNAGGYYEARAYCPRPGQFAMILMDISERKRAEEALRESESRFRELANAMPQLVWMADADGAVTFVSRQWREQLGIPEEAALGWGWPRVLHPDDRARVEAAWRDCVECGEPFRVECRIRAAGGEYRWHLMRGVSVCDEQQRITGWYGTCTDIDDTKRAEERLRQVQKLQSVGLLAGGIAHDFNNLLTGILGNASLLASEVTPAQAERVREVVNSAERAAHLIRQLLAYAGKSQLIVREIDVARAVNELADLVRASIPTTIDLSITTEQGLPKLRMDPGQLHQVVMNLVVNAGEAIGEGIQGKITVSVFLTHVAERFADAIGEEVAPGRYIAIEVADTGSGIDEEMKARIFDPFFTTKFTGRGLGLAAVAGIMRSEKGGLTVESAAGQGATFRVLLPAGEQARTGGVEASAESGRAILVVDDERAVRDFIAAVLRKQGHRVLTAADGREALAIWEREKSGIEALVVDVVMPVMGGFELLRRVKRAQPDIKVLLTSGYSESEARSLCAAHSGAAFLPKPCTAQQVTRAVEQLLQAA